MRSGGSVQVALFGRSASILGLQQNQKSDILIKDRAGVRLRFWTGASGRIRRVEGLSSPQSNTKVVFGPLILCKVYFKKDYKIC